MMNLKHLWVATVLAVGCSVSGCQPSQPNTKALYLLVDISGSYSQEISKAQALSNYLLAQTQSGDFMAVANINSASFSEKNIIALATFEERPSTANQQKQMFKHNVDTFVKQLKRGSAYTDVSGGILQGAQYLKEVNAREKYLIVFSDFEEDLPHDYTRNFPIELAGINVVAVNVTKLRGDNKNPQQYLKRINNWQQRVEQGGGHWQLLNDIERVNTLLAVH